MKELHNLVMALAPDFAQQHAIMVVKDNARDAKVVAKTDVPVDVHRGVKHPAVVGADKVVQISVFRNAQ